MLNRIVWETLVGPVAGATDNRTPPIACSTRWWGRWNAASLLGCLAQSRRHGEYISDTLSYWRQTPDQHVVPRAQATLGLVERHRIRPVDHLTDDVLATIGWQLVVSGAGTLARLLAGASTRSESPEAGNAICRVGWPYVGLARQRP